MLRIRITIFLLLLFVSSALPHDFTGISNFTSVSNIENSAELISQYGRVGENEAKAHLDNAIVSLRNNPGSKLFIYAGAPDITRVRRFRRGGRWVSESVLVQSGTANATRRINLAVGYITRSRRIPNDWVRSQSGRCDSEFTRIYLVPEGDSAPSFNCQ
jgi:hypothetical protein